MSTTSTTIIESDGTIKGFNDWVKRDGSTEFQPEAGRYHLYGQHLCPFSNRTTIGRILKGLEKVISFDNADYERPGGRGWEFTAGKEGVDVDSVNGCSYLCEVYEASAKKLGASGYSGTVSVPVLFDKKLGRIVSNDSASILRMFNSEFNEICETQEQKELDLYPKELRSEIDEVEGWTQPAVIFGVYGPNRATTQEQYDQAIDKLYSGLDKLEELLSKRRYLCGKRLTEADIRLFVTLVRFDPVYTQMKCSKKRIADYPALWAYVRDIYQTKNIRSLMLFDQIVKGYFLSYNMDANPHKIVPALPQLNYDEPANREHL